MKTFLFLFVFLFVTIIVFAQASIKEAVCLIAVGQIHYIKGGSGFLISDGEGNQYIVTNDHVTEKSGAITVVFNDNGGIKRFEDMSVLAIDPLYDLSILAFPMGRKTNRQSFKIDISKVDKGLECSAAGFPEMEWSFSDGILLDNNINTYRSGTIQPFIAHSAPINFGSSGGPLLRRQTDQPTGWVVIGVNTLKAKNGPYFAIPSRRIIELLNKAVERKTQGKISQRKNNRKEEAVQIQSEEPIFTSIEGIDHVGWYYFSPTCEGDLELLFNSTESFKFEIYDEGGKMLASNYGNDQSLNIHISLNDLYIKVSGDNLIYWTTYRISAYFKSFSPENEHISANLQINKYKMIKEGDIL